MLFIKVIGSRKSPLSPTHFTLAINDRLPHKLFTDIKTCNKYPLQAAKVHTNITRRSICLEI